MVRASRRLESVRYWWGWRASNVPLMHIKVPANTLHSPLPAVNGSVPTLRMSRNSLNIKWSVHVNFRFNCRPVCGALLGALATLRPLISCKHGQSCWPISRANANILDGGLTLLPTLFSPDWIDSAALKGVHRKIALRPRNRNCVNKQSS